jgi:Peptidase M15
MIIKRLALGAAIILLAIVTLATPSLAQDAGNWASEIFSKSNARSAASSERTQRRSAKPTRTREASVRVRKPRISDDEPVTSGRSLAGSAITWQASSGCVPGQLRGVLADLVSNYGPVTVTSTCRSVASNRAAGGASQSYHLSGEAVDFRVGANTSAVYAYLSSNSSVGGLKHYGGGLFHIDTGPRRSF